jgi:hypothetical protein
MITFREFRQKLIERVGHARDLDEYLPLDEDSTFYIYRTDTNAVLARGIQGFEAAKERANQIRKSHNLKWDQVKFKSERGLKDAGSASSTSSGKKSQFGPSSGGRTFTNAYGKRYPVEYSRNVNPSKGRRFRGYTDAQGNYHDID